MALNDSSNEFSLQNCRMILITLQGERGIVCRAKQASTALLQSTITYFTHAMPSSSCDTHSVASISSCDMVRAMAAFAAAEGDPRAI